MLTGRSSGAETRDLAGLEQHAVLTFVVLAVVRTARAPAAVAIDLAGRGAIRRFGAAHRTVDRDAAATRMHAELIGLAGRIAAGHGRRRLGWMAAGVAR